MYICDHTSVFLQNSSLFWKMVFWVLSNNKNHFLLTLCVKFWYTEDFIFSKLFRFPKCNVPRHLTLFEVISFCKILRIFEGQELIKSVVKIRSNGQLNQPHNIIHFHFLDLSIWLRGISNQNPIFLTLFVSNTYQLQFLFLYFSVKQIIK